MSVLEIEEELDKAIRTLRRLEEELKGEWCATLIWERIRRTEHCIRILRGELLVAKEMARNFDDQNSRGTE